MKIIIEKLFLKNRSTSFVIIIFVVLLTPILSISMNLTYISLFDDSKPSIFGNAILFSPIVFLAYGTVVLTKKGKGFLWSTVAGLTAFTVQFAIYGIVTFFFAMLDGVSPRFIKNDPNLTTELINRYQSNYGITLSESDEILHTSRWSIGEEFGTDLIFKIADNKIDRLLPSELVYSILSEKTTKLPFRFTNLQFLCKDGLMSSTIMIENEPIRQLVCSKGTYPSNVLIAEKMVREEWTITTVIFPDEKIAWITETEW